MKESKPIIKFEIGSKQPFALFFIFAIILSSLFLITALALSGFSFAGLSSLPTGDINNDGKINSADTLEIFLYEKKLKELSGSQLDAADINSDSNIDFDDALLIIQYSSGERKKLGDLSNTSSTSEQYEIPTQSYEEIEPTPPVQEVTFNRSGSSENGAFLTSEKDLYYTVRIVNSWQDSNGKYMYQLQLKVKNNSFKSMYSTSADVILSGNAQVEKDWDCSAKIDGNSIHIVTDDIGPIKHDKTYSCGLIISSDSELKINGIEKP